MTQSQLTDGSDAPQAADVWYYGVNAIAKRMGWSAFKVMTANQQMAFPLVRLPSSHGKHWVYATSDLLIEKWLHVQIDMAYDYVAQTALGRKLRRTRGLVPASTNPGSSSPASPEPAPEQNIVSTATSMPEVRHASCIDGGGVKQG